MGGAERPGFVRFPGVGDQSEWRQNAIHASVKASFSEANQKPWLWDLRI